MMASQSSLNPKLSKMARVFTTSILRSAVPGTVFRDEAFVRGARFRLAPTVQPDETTQRGTGVAHQELAGHRGRNQDRSKLPSYAAPL